MTATRPVVSIIVPLVHHLGQAVESVTRWNQQAYPRERIEILVVSDGAEPDLDQQLRGVLGPRGRVLRRASVWERELLDYGARQARGELLVFTEPHVLAAPDFLHEMVTFLESTGHAGACCHSEGRYDNAIGRQAYREFVKSFRVWSAPGNSGKVLIHGFTIDRRAYLAVGGYPHQYQGFADTPLAMRLEQHGYSLGYAPRAKVCHVFLSHLGEHLARVRDYTIGQLAYRRDHPDEDGPELPSRDWRSRPDVEPGMARHMAKTLLRRAPRALVRADGTLLRAALRSCRDLTWRRLDGPLVVANWRRLLAILRTHCWRWHPGRLESAYQDAYRLTAEWTRLRFLANEARVARLGAQASAPIEGDGEREGAGRTWTIQEFPVDRLAGFHYQEVWQNRVFRWSLPTAGLRLPLPPGGGRVVLDTGALRGDAPMDLRVFIDGRQMPAHSVQTANGLVTLAIPPEPHRECDSLVFWTCSPLEPSKRGQRDRRRLGLPLVSVTIQSSADVPIHPNSMVGGQGPPPRSARARKEKAHAIE
jgi:hypothetical protein